MGNKFIKTSLLALGLLVVPILFAGANQQEQKQDQKEDIKVYRATALNDIFVKNGTGDNAQTLGQVEDFVINLRTGDIVYYAMSHGQVLGLGGKMFAIAPQALKPTPKGDFFILEGVSNQDLDNADGFNANDWPREPDKRWSKGKNGVNEKVKDAVQEAKKGLKENESLGRVNAILGMSVRTPANQTLGTVFDLAIKVQGSDHQVMYATVSHGGALGVGGKLYAVPLDKLVMSSPKLNPNDRVFILHTTAEELKNLRGFTSGDNWPAEVDKNFWSKVKGGQENRENK